MTPRELADLLMRARAAGVLGAYFDHEPAPLAALLTLYGDERAAQERERNRQTVRAERRARLLEAWHAGPFRRARNRHAAAALKCIEQSLT